MKNFTLFFAFFLFVFQVFAQKIHTPAEILKIMTDSKLSYEITVLDTTIECKDNSGKLNYHDCYRISTDTGIYTYKFSINDKAKSSFDKAENFFQTHNSDSALVYYKLAIIADSSLFNVMTYIGQIYGSQGDYYNAIKWYKNAISKNYIDYMAHWFLADSYLEIYDLKNAVDEIVVAQILNRNNPRIKKSMVKIFNQAKRNTEDWCFTPQVEINKISENKISVALNDKWTGYALAKALWTYEPGYKESMGVSEGEHSTIEDKECLISLLIGLENAKIKTKQDPQLRILKEAAENNRLDEYILYEIVLPQTPFIAFQLPEKTILDIKDYILDVRNLK